MPIKFRKEFIRTAALMTAAVATRLFAQEISLSERVQRDLENNKIQACFDMAIDNLLTVATQAKPSPGARRPVPIGKGRAGDVACEVGLESVSASFAKAGSQTERDAYIALRRAGAPALQAVEVQKVGENTWQTKPIALLQKTREGYSVILRNAAERAGRIFELRALPALPK
ncbi:MAG: hypothetical protein M3N08_06880 [Pseudomonadota bacterium]|nr:hypothetical protein [Pseudomonadota bacterium]